MTDGHDPHGGRDEFDPAFDAEFEALLRDAGRTYHRPPDLPETESLWTAIDAALPAAATPERPQLTVVRGDTRSLARRLLANPWLRSAAVLFIGVALGRVSVRAGVPSPIATSAVVASADAADSARPSADPFAAERVATTEYLGRTEALLAALPAELEARRADPSYKSQADALLLQTRLLLDSPAAADPALRALFDDLELVLAQVVRLRADRSDPTSVEFLHQALEQRDVLPRLRDAVADNAAD